MDYRGWTPLYLMEHASIRPKDDAEDTRNTTWLDHDAASNLKLNLKLRVVNHMYGAPVMTGGYVILIVNKLCTG